MGASRRDGLTGRAGGRPGGPAGRRSGAGGKVVAVAALLVVALVAVVVWLVVAGPLSSQARAERQVEALMRDLGHAESLAEFNDLLCAEQKLPQDMIDAIAGSGTETGVDLDAMFREQLLGQLPEDLEVVELDRDGDSAVATVRSTHDGDETTERIRVREEDGSWVVCEPGVGR